MRERERKKAKTIASEDIRSDLTRRKNERFVKPTSRVTSSFDRANSNLMKH